jgi:hypothetical protein
MLQHLDPALSAEIRATVGHLPKWKGDPTGNAIDYTGSKIGYVVNVSLMHGNMQWHPSGLNLPTPDTRVLLVERASGDGEVGTESGISGYIDNLDDPYKQLTREAFDPVGYAARAEPHEEVGIAWETMSTTIDFSMGAVVRTEKPLINLGLGERFEEPRHKAPGKNVIATVLGVCNGPELPELRLKEDEISNATWVPYGELASRRLSRGFLENTVPSVLGGALGLRRAAINDLIRPR